jgi:hypothetical protein
MRTFIGGIGSRDSDAQSIGIRVSERLASDAPINAAGVVVADVSGDPIDVAERLNGEWPKFERVIFVGAVARARPAGTVTAYRWDGHWPNEDRANGSDAASDDGGSFDRTMLAVRGLTELPDEIIVVEIEPEVAAEAGDGANGRASTMERARTLVRRLATNARAASSLPHCALGEVPTRHQRGV